MGFFEGSEKKVEVIVADHVVDLRTLGAAFWEQVVSQANATVLSRLQSDECDAFLLSESSLFVWRNRFLMITCGVTALVDAVLFFAERFREEDLLFVCYQRKNEYNPRLQKSSFEEDIKRLHKVLPGRAFRLGNLDSHHYYLFHLDKPFKPEPEDVTFELLMYHIQGSVADALRTPNLTAEHIRRELRLDEILPGFVLDDFAFEPIGYSLNALRGNHYATIHITPEASDSYVSFETNLDLQAEGASIPSHFVEVLQPGAWDVMTYNSVPPPTTRPQTFLANECNLSLQCGFYVRYHHYHCRKSGEVTTYDLSL